jgi:hypothetical protein
VLKERSYEKANNLKDFESKETKVLSRIVKVGKCHLFLREERK